MPRIFLPPGPISAPIFSGLILIRMMRGAKSDSSARGCGDHVVHLVEDEQPGLAGLREGFLHDLEG